VTSTGIAFLAMLQSIGDVFGLMTSGENFNSQ
jgi:hypothetical protein